MIKKEERDIESSKFIRTDKEEIILSIIDSIEEITVDQLFEKYVLKEKYQGKKEIGVCYEQVEDKYYENTLMGYTASIAKIKVIHFPAALDLLKAYLDIWLRLKLSLFSKMYFKSVIDKAKCKGLFSPKGASRAHKFRRIRNKFSHIAEEENLVWLLERVSVKKGQAGVDIPFVFFDQGTEALINFILAGLDCKALKVKDKEDN